MGLSHNKTKRPYILYGFLHRGSRVGRGRLGPLHRVHGSDCGPASLWVDSDERNGVVSAE